MNEQDLKKMAQENPENAAKFVNEIYEKSGEKLPVPPKNIEQQFRIQFNYKRIRADVVDRGKGNFILQIFSNVGQFSPMMHPKMLGVLNKAIRKRINISPTESDMKVDFVVPLNSYCVRISNVKNFMWEQLFQSIVEDIDKDFKIEEFTNIIKPRRQ